ncbi:hypothetical protein [Streptomyces sp. 061-3]|uniref:hypothetical protein n=1 Tax=Streptomyces sp. 061-3 TaxID=2789268 RepID=UPI003980356C
MTITYEWRGDIDNSALNTLHAEGFDHPVGQTDWRAKLQRHSLGWVCAWEDHRLVGFVNVAKAGALLQTLSKLPCLEHSGEAFAWHSTEAYLALNGHRLDYPPKAAVALVRDAAAGTLGVARIARQLRDWTNN